jgi:low molecular weight protein-tyrosine phosphatase
MELMGSVVQQMQDKKSILFVCMGNICRSPALAGALQSITQKRNAEGAFFVDSAGLTAYYVGSPVDERMKSAMHKRGITLAHIAKLFHPNDFSRFDFIFAVSKEVEEHLLRLARTPEERKKIHLATKFSEKYKDEEIPDPYSLGMNAFDRVAEIVLDAAKGIATTL